ncbi:GGDEF domain-containing protein [Acidisphaera rubrifaciens]|uniref:diguanylate cyclase n=1 Tax=Acidisphaera rubrifaciens HS-AP3 TaxID=1231350 RepID=A0A0D6P8J3_9PROT|nr:GGDEF domain-containing protein [Acidisphaera rubrifaciens]GAN77992.1 diguanylate cyclase [Acidisphaera rubrifaciens HS-AP3]
MHDPLLKDQLGAAPTLTAPALTAAAQAFQTRRLADAVWSEMQVRGIVPSPRNFTLWFTYRSGSDPRLNRRMAELIGRAQPIAPALLDALYQDCLASGEDLTGASIDAAAEIEAAARTLIEQLSGSETALAGYGDALVTAQRDLRSDRGRDDLLRAVAVLATETARAAERNRLLQQQLASSASRVGRMRQALAAMKAEATHDALTGIANRRAFDTRLRHAIRQRSSQPQALTVLLVDIDHFKAFNDAHGHRTGDLVLRLVARVLASNVKGRDCAARYGGEEFAVLLAGADLEAGGVVARQICQELSSKRLVEGAAQGALRITVSIGVAQYGAPETPTALIQRADAAMYEAKQLGRNQVCLAPPPAVGRSPSSPTGQVRSNPDGPAAAAPAPSSETGGPPP